MSSSKGNPLRRYSKKAPLVRFKIKLTPDQGKEAQRLEALASAAEERGDLEAGSSIRCELGAFLRACIS